jgi:hypothetical protein
MCALARCLIGKVAFEQEGVHRIPLSLFFFAIKLAVERVSDQDGLEKEFYDIIYDAVTTDTTLISYQYFSTLQCFFQDRGAYDCSRSALSRLTSYERTSCFGGASIHVAIW